MNIFAILGRNKGLVKIADLLKLPQILEALGVNINASTLPTDAEGFLVSDGAGTTQFTNAATFTDVTISATSDVTIDADGELNLFGNEVVLDADSLIGLTSQNNITLLAADEIVIDSPTTISIGDVSANANSTTIVVDDENQSIIVVQAGATPATPALIVAQTASLPTGVTLKLADQTAFGNPAGHGISFERSSVEEASIINTGDALVIDTSGTRDIQLGPGGNILFTTLPTYADNAAAVTGGLAVGGVYKTATGELRIRV